MGFSSEAIFIKSAIPEAQHIELLAALGFDDIHFIHQAYFEEADTRGKSGVYIGNYNGATILIYDGMLDGYRDQYHFLKVERTLANLLPQHQIMSVMNVESVNGYLYHYIVDAKTSRLKYGAHGQLPIEVGDELAEEKALYVRREIRGNEEIYLKKSYDDDGKLQEWTHDQVGGDMAFSMASLIIGESFYNIPLDLKLNQYLSTKQISRYKEIEAPTEWNKGNSYFSMKVIASDFLPLLESQVVPLFSKEGFVWDKEHLTFSRTVNQIEHTFSLSRQQAGLLINLSVSDKVTTNVLRNWINEKYGIDRFGGDLSLDEKQPALHDREIVAFPQLQTKKITVEELIALLEFHVVNNVLPSFNLLSSVEAFAEHSFYRCFRADFYLMLGQKDEAWQQLVALGKLMRKESNPAKYYEDIDVRLAYAFPGMTREDLQEKIQIGGHLLNEWEKAALLKAWQDGWELMQNDRIFTPEMRTFDEKGKVNIAVIDKEEPQALEEHYKTIAPLPVMAILQHCGDVLINNRQMRSLVSRIKIGDQIDRVCILPVSDKVNFTDPFSIVETLALTPKEASQRVSYIFEPLFGNKRITVIAQNEDMVPIQLKINKASKPSHWKAIEADINPYNVNFRDGSGATFLHNSIHSAPPSFVEYLLKSGADPNIANFRYGRTPAFYANDVAKHLLLINHGLNVNHQDLGGWTAAQYELHVKDVFKTYIDHGLNLALKSVQGISILFELIGKPDELKLAADKGIDLNEQDNWGLTLLHHSVFSYHVGTVELLLQRKARTDIKTLKTYGDPADGMVIPENTTARELLFIMKDWRAMPDSGEWKAEYVANTSERFDKIWSLVVDIPQGTEKKGTSQNIIPSVKPTDDSEDSTSASKIDSTEIGKLKFRSTLGGALRGLGFISMMIGLFASTKAIIAGGIMILIGWIIKSSAQKSLSEKEQS